MNRWFCLPVILAVLGGGAGAGAQERGDLEARIQGFISQGETRKAEEALSAPDQDQTLPLETREKAYYLLGVVYLERLEFGPAALAFEQIRPQAGPGLKAAFLARECRKAGEIRRDSPFLAGFLSFLLPGLGQLYLHRTTDAAWAAGLSLTPAAIAALGWRAGSWLVCAPAGLVSLIFYGGAVYNAVNQAHKGNRRRLEELRDRLLIQAQALPGEP